MLLVKRQTTKNNIKMLKKSQGGSNHWIFAVYSTGVTVLFVVWIFFCLFSKQSGFSRIIGFFSFSTVQVAFLNICDWNADKATTQINKNILAHRKHFYIFFNFCVPFYPVFNAFFLSTSPPPCFFNRGLFKVVAYLNYGKVGNPLPL